MTPECWEAMLFCTAIAMGIGMFVGSWLEGWAWRISAADFKTMKSRGEHYVVRRQ